MSYEYTVECRYNAVQFITTSSSESQWQHQNENQTSESQQTPHTSPSRASYGVPIVMICDKIDRVITAPHCIWVKWADAKPQQNTTKSESWSYFLGCTVKSLV